jgi:hypothetical protein
VKTHWAWPTSATTSSFRKAANSAARLAPHEGHRPLPLHEKARRNSAAQSGQRMRAKPRSKMPQSRYRATTPSRRPRQKP